MNPFSDSTGTTDEGAMATHTTTLLDHVPDFTITFNDEYHEARASSCSISRPGKVIECDGKHVLVGKFVNNCRTRELYKVSSGGYHTLSVEIIRKIITTSGYVTVYMF